MNDTKVFIWIIASAMLCFVIWALTRQIGAWRQSRVALVSDDKYRALTDEYRRLSDMAITTQEHTDLRLADLAIQVEDLRGKLDQMQRILKDVDMDRHPHLEQISVRADLGRQGIGSLLLSEVVRRSGAGLTLITYRDVPWNGPWYLRHGFVKLPETAWGPQLRAHWQAEIDAGLHDLGPRLVMHVPAAGAVP